MRNGLTVVTCATRRTGPGALNPAVKSLNYLNNVMARIEANLAGADEALMLNDAGHARGMHRRQCFHHQTRRNFYAADYGGSVARNHAIGRFRDRGGARNQNFRDRYHAGTMFLLPTNVFLTGTAAEVIPVIKADGRVIGTGKPGPISLRMIGRFREITRETRHADFFLTMPTAIRRTRC